MGKRLNILRAIFSRHGLPWEQKEHAKLRKYFNKGYSLDRMTFLLRRSHNAISYQLVELGLVKEKFIQENWHEFSAQEAD